MLLSMLFDDDDETAVTALFQVGDQVLQLKQKPHEGRVYDKDKEDRQEYAMAHPEEDYHPSSANDKYDSAFPNVGLVVWQSGFVLGEYLLRAKPLGPWNKPLRVLEFGCGTGQLGIVLALAGADVVLTDLDHITPLTQVNIDLNAARCSVVPRAVPYKWGTDIATISSAAQQQPDQQQQPEALSEAPHQQQAQQHRPWDVIVAADVLYEPQHYDELLMSLTQLCPATVAASSDVQQGANLQPSSAHHHHQQQQVQDPGPGSSWRSPPIYICYRVRRYGEHSFESKAEKYGFDVAAIPVENLHADYRCGGYRLIQLTRRQSCSI